MTGIVGDGLVMIVCPNVKFDVLYHVKFGYDVLSQMWQIVLHVLEI